MQSTSSVLPSRDEPFLDLLSRARAEQPGLLDLAGGDPTSYGLGLEAAECGAELGALPPGGADLRVGAARARDAAASYLAGRGGRVRPEHVRVVSSRAEAQRLALRLVCDPGDEIAVPSPDGSGIGGAASAAGVGVRRYALRFDGAWNPDRRALERALTRRTRALFVGNPSDPTGAVVGAGELSYLERVCAESGIALIGDEAFADTAVVPCATVASVTRCLAVQLSGLSGICGLSRLGVEWCALAGPEPLVAAALSRAGDPGDHAVPAGEGAVALHATPALLARREAFLSTLRTRLAVNRASIAAGAIGECPWSLLWGGGGCWAVLEVGAAEPGEALCRSLLEDGVAVLPGTLFGLPDHGRLVASLLPSPDAFRDALSRIDRRLRAPVA